MAEHASTPTERRYEVAASSTDTFGRVLCSARQQHFVVDGPAANGCPGEAVTPAELFLAGVATCGVELLQVIARSRNLPVPTVAVDVAGVMDPARRTRPDVTLFSEVHIRFTLGGVDHEQAGALVEAFKSR